MKYQFRYFSEISCKQKMSYYPQKVWNLEEQMKTMILHPCMGRHWYMHGNMHSDMQGGMHGDALNKPGSGKRKNSIFFWSWKYKHYIGFLSSKSKNIVVPWRLCAENKFSTVT